MASVLASRPLSFLDPGPSYHQPHYRKRSQIYPPTFYHRANTISESRDTIPFPSVSRNSLIDNMKDTRKSPNQDPESPVDTEEKRSRLCHDSLFRRSKKSMKKQASLPLLKLTRPSSSAGPATRTSDESEHESPAAETVAEKEPCFEQKKYFITRNGMKHHPYSIDDAPYMQSYDPILLDNDRVTNSLLRRINQNGTPTFHDYGRNPPAKVLDLGCGQGRWVVEAATAWKSFGTKITGFDLVDLVSDAWDLDRSVADNITWAFGNFVKYKLPFPDATFNLVRVANLSLCIPYDQWNFVLKEVYRVLVPAGRLELIDDQIFFPYEKNIPKSPLSATAPRRRPTSSAFEFDSDDDDAELADAASIVDTESTESPQKPPEAPPDPSAEWDEQADAAKDLETVFEHMLQHKHRIHPRIGKAIEPILEDVFGPSNYMKMHSMHLALAPRDHGSGDASKRDSDTSSLGSTDTLSRKSVSSRESKNWMTIEWEKREKKKEKKGDKVKGDRSSGESFTGPSHIPETLSVKAALRLGITALPNRTTAQSPGLILWPSTFIPVPPVELEMHACKNVHMLLGCKSALTDYIRELKDGNGDRMIGDARFEESVWNYECFRRKRFSWPSNLPSLRMDENETAPDQPTPKSAPFRNSISSDSSPSIFMRPRSGSSSGGSTFSLSSTSTASSGKYTREELTFVRTIRVYDAYKIDETVKC